jgi:hypothetical protein
MLKNNLSSGAAPLAALFECLKGQCDGVSIADATSIAVCDNMRIPRNRVSKDSAKRGKTSKGWFFLKIAPKICNRPSKKKTELLLLALFLRL